jgi:hypothetical protein
MAAANVADCVGYQYRFSQGRTDMNRTHAIRLIIAALLVTVLLVAVIGLPGGTSSSAEQATVTRSPRPHPKSHLSVTPTSIGLDNIARSPRPHPKSHIELLVDRP